MEVQADTRYAEMRHADKGGRLGYRMAKSSLNQLTVSLATEQRLAGQKLAFIALHPGRVRTRLSGFNGAIDVEESANGMVKVIEDLKLEQSGDFVRYDGEKMAW